MIDTGSSTLLISLQLAKKLKVKINPLPSNTLPLHNASMQKMNILGIATFTLTIGGLLFEQDFQVMDGLAHSCLLGRDFTNKYKVAIDFNANVVTLCDNTTYIHPLPTPTFVSKLPVYTNTVNLIVAATNITIPAKHEYLAQGFLRNASKNINNFSYGIVEPLPILDTQNFLIARSLIERPQKVSFPILLVNPCAYPIKIKAKRPLAHFFEIDRQEYREYPWHKNISNTPQQGAELSHITNFNNTGNNIVNPLPVNVSSSQSASQLDPTKKYKTLEELGVKLDLPHLSAADQQKVKKLLEDNVDVFATEFIDMASRPPINYQHSIDVPPNMPIIRLKNYKHSAEDEKLIEENVQQMLKSGIVKLSTSPFNSPLVLIKSAEKGTS